MRGSKLSSEFFLLQNLQTVSETHPAFHLILEFFPGINLLGYQADHSYASRTEVKNEWSCASTPSLRLFGVDRDNLTYKYLLVIFQPIAEYREC